MGELVFLLILLILCAVCFVQTLSFPVSILDQSGGPALFPQIVLALLTLVIVIRLIQFFREKKHEHFVFRELFTGRRLFFFGSLIVYVFLFDFLGYILSTALFLVVTINYFYYVVKGNRGSVKAILVRNISAIAFSVIMYVFFANILHIMLPTGQLFA